MASLNRQYDAIIGWSELYDGASIETKKMIVNCLIKRIDVYRDYRVHIDWGIDFDQFQFGLDLKKQKLPDMTNDPFLNRNGPPFQSPRLMVEISGIEPLTS